jgi:hypothetical protein
VGLQGSRPVEEVLESKRPQQLSTICRQLLRWKRFSHSKLVSENTK